MSIFSRDWLSYAGERALKTAIQTFAACLATNYLTAMDWGMILSLVLSATIASLATSMNATSLAPGQADISALPPLPDVVLPKLETAIEQGEKLAQETVYNIHNVGDPEALAKSIGRQVDASLRKVFVAR